MNIFCLRPQDGWGQGGADLLLLPDVRAQVVPGQTPKSPNFTFEACAQETTLPLGSGLLLVWSSLGLCALGISGTKAVENVHKGALYLHIGLTAGYKSVLVVGGWQRGGRAVFILEFSVKVSYLKSEREK